MKANPFARGILGIRDIANCVAAVGIVEEDVRTLSANHAGSAKVHVVLIVSQCRAAKSQVTI